MGTNDKRDATFHPGQAPVSWPEALAAHGSLPEVPPPDDEIPWASPGRPPWASQVHQDLAVQHGWPTPGEKRRGLPAWAWVSMILGVVALCVTGGVVTALVDESGPVPVVRTPASAVTTSGTCEKRIVGEYGLVATVTAVNGTDKDQAGSVWVQWPITGESAQRFVKPVTLAPGASVEHVVSQDIPAERWFRTGACSFGWAPQG